MKTIFGVADSFLYWVIVLIPFSLAIGPAFTNVLLGLTAVLFLLKMLLKKESLYVATPINLAFLLFILAGFLSFKNSVDYGNSLHGVTKLLKYGAIFLVISSQIKDRRHFENIAISAAIGACLVSIDAFWQIGFGRDFIRGNVLQSAIGMVRPTASFPNPNVMGIYLSAVTPLIAGIGLFYYKGKAKLVMMAAFVIAAIGLYLTFSRGSGLGLYAALLFMAIVRKKKVLIAFLIAVIIVFPFVMPKNIKDWSKEVKYNPIVFLFNYDRLSMYRNALNMIGHHPVCGVGINTFAQNYHRYKLSEPENGRTPDTSYAHNSYLQMTAETGVVGLSAFILMLFLLFRFFVMTYKNIKDDYFRIVSMSIAACILAYLVNSMTETSLYYPRVVMIFWFLVGCLLAFQRFLPRKSS